MSVVDFVKDKIVFFICSFLSIIISIFCFNALNPNGGIQLSIYVFLILIIGIYTPFIFEYRNKKNFYNTLISIFDSLDKKNLIAELIDKPSFNEGIILYYILKGSNKAMLEEINKYKYMQAEYKEYIEMWVHEIKTPIASSRLIVSNNKNEITDSILEEIDKIENYIEQVLFHSRSNNVEKDYIIKEINLEKLCFDVIKKNAKLYIQNKIKIVTNNLKLTVFCDSKWLEFILNQILINSVKYSKDSDKYIKISAEKLDNSIILSIKDNGIGIKDNELSKIFDKGFTGTNGRKKERTTGMGLYICKKLCNKLGLEIKAYSLLNEGTKIDIIFPKNSMMDILR